MSNLQIHIVDSVKGGSGKSSFSAKLCCALNYSGRKACVIDLDLLGTSWYHLYFKAVSTHTPKDEIVYLNDLVDDFDYYIKTVYMQQINFNFSGTALQVDVILANENENAKRKYRITDKANTTDISFSFFSNIVFRLIDVLKNSYTDIILDMPPNSDPYSDKVLHECLRPGFEFQTSVYMVSSLNLAHVKSTFYWYTDLIYNTTSQHIVSKNDFAEYFSDIYISSDSHKERRKNWLEKSKNKFFIVFNNISNTDKPILSQNDKKTLVDLGVERIKSQLAYYFINFDDNFYRNTDAIQSRGETVINFGNTFSCDTFELYFELKD